MKRNNKNLLSQNRKCSQHKNNCLWTLSDGTKPAIEASVGDETHSHFKHQVQHENTVSGKNDE